MSKKLILPIFIYCLLYLIANPLISRQIVVDTLRLWHQSVIPALFPTILLIQYYLLMQPVSCMPYFLAATISIGCGFPIGTWITCKYGTIGKIKPGNVPIYCAMLNQFSPAFIQSYVGTTILHSNPHKILFLYYCVMVFSALVSYPIIKHWSAYESNRFITLKETLPTIQEEQSFSKAILLSSEILLRLFGYMFLCNSIITMLSSIKFLKTITILISPLLEVTTGLIGYVTAYDATKQIPYIFAVLNFGGLSGCLQVIPVLKKDNYSIKCYLFSKCILMVTTYIITKLLILFI